MNRYSENMFRFSLAFILFLVIVSTSFTSVMCYNSGNIYLTISAYKKNLVLNWDFTNDLIPDTLLLINTAAQVTLQQVLVDRPRGHLETNHGFEISTYFPGNWDRLNDYPESGAHCFHYSIQALKNNATVDAQCLKIEPTWMEKFGDLQLANMMLPGTHDSGAFITKSITRFFKRFVLTQNTDIWTQLVFGIRYLDLRVGIYNDEFYLYHGIARCAKLEPELRSVLSFLEKAKQEVVILDFHEFSEPFSHQLHKRLQSQLQSILGHYILSNPLSIYANKLTLKQIWNMNKRVIVNYNDRTQVSETPWLMAGLRRDWGNLQKPDQLIDYIKYLTSRPRDGLIHILCAELTLTTNDILKDFTASLKKLADEVNPELSPLLRESNRSHRFGIVATDFHLGNDIVNVAIETNIRKVNAHSYY